MTTLACMERRFFEPDAAQVAAALLGHYLVVGHGDSLRGGLIVETEAYRVDDPASHGFRGETARNRSMFGEPGTAYVYFIYGNHHCVNVVCRERGLAEAVLIRALAPRFGMEAMRRCRRGLPDRQWTSGPGKLCAALGIDRSHDGLDLCDSTSAVRLARHPNVAEARREQGPIVSGPRVGISKAATWPLRFRLAGSVFCSGR